MTRMSITMQVLDRDLMVEKAATMLRKGSTAAEVCAALRISDTALRKLAAAHGFRYPTAPYSLWPAADDPGDPWRPRSAYDNWRRSVAGAAATLEANGR